MSGCARAPQAPRGRLPDEARRVKMPSFHGYLIYSALLLIPLFAGITFVFFR